MIGKIGLVVGFGAGYVLGSRAGRERYEQIKKAAGNVWQMDPVQEQVAKVKQIAKSSAVRVPKQLFKGAVKVISAATENRSEHVSVEQAPVKQAAETKKPAASKSPTSEG